VAQQEGIAGVVLDVEPYLLDEWDTDRNRVERAYLRMLKLARRASSDLPLMAAVPFWFDHDTYRNASGTLAERVAARVDALVVMAYRDELSVGDGIVALARGEIEVAARLDKVAMVALQTAADDLDKLTFFEEDRDALGRAVMAIEGTPGFGGVALHHYRAYRELRGGSEDS
jgi:hypothetical protein